MFGISNKKSWDVTNTYTLTRCFHWNHLNKNDFVTKRSILGFELSISILKEIFSQNFPFSHFLCLSHNHYDI